MNILPLATSLATITLISGFTHAASSVSASAFVGEGNQMNSNILGSSGFSSTPLQNVQGAGDSSHDLTEVGGSGTLEFSGIATATASYNSLRAAASGSLSNSFLDENYDFDGSVGVPTAYYAQGSAQFSQTLQYGGTANSYTSTYALRLTGNIAGSGRAAVTVEMQHAMETPQSWFFTTAGDYDLILYSQAYIHGQFAQEFTLRINTLYSFDMDSLPPGQSFSGGAEFGNTLEVVGIDLRDEFGTLQDAGAITSDSGQVFTIAAVPEPSSLLLATSGLAAACLIRGRRKRGAVR